MEIYNNFAPKSKSGFSGRCNRKIYRWLVDVSPVERLLVALCVARMFGKRTGKIVGSGKIFLGTHIQVIVTGVIQYAFHSLYGGNPDRSGRKSGIFIGIIRTFHLEVLVEDTAQSEILQTELDGRICLQGHWR